MKIAIFGDSISEGIGQRKIRYDMFLAQYLSDCEVINYSKSGTTIRYVEKIKESWSEENFDVAIVFYGNVDAMLRPNQKSKFNLYKIIPKRYKLNGMLNPRPYFSKKFFKRIFQKLDSLFRCSLNKFLCKVQGTTTYLSARDFYEVYSEFLTELKYKNCKIILCSCVFLDDRFFPGTNLEYEKFNEIIKRLAVDFGANYVDFYNYVMQRIVSKKMSFSDFYYDDHFHPNQQGYELMAKMFSEEIKQIGKF